jgi:hypothetical protein
VVVSGLRFLDWTGVADGFGVRVCVVFVFVFWRGFVLEGRGWR